MNLVINKTSVIRGSQLNQATLALHSIPFVAAKVSQHLLALNHKCNNRILETHFPLDLHKHRLTMALYCVVPVQSEIGEADTLLYHQILMYLNFRQFEIVANTFLNLPWRDLFAFYF